MARKGRMSHFKRPQLIDRIFIILMAIIFLWCHSTAGKINNDSQTTNSNPISERCQLTYRNLSSLQMAKCKYNLKRLQGNQPIRGSKYWTSIL